MEQNLMNGLQKRLSTPPSNGERRSLGLAQLALGEQLLQALTS